jgi:hypothetical protein
MAPSVVENIEFQPQQPQRIQQAEIFLVTRRRAPRPWLSPLPPHLVNDNDAGPLAAALRNDGPRERATLEKVHLLQGLYPDLEVIGKIKIHPEFLSQWSEKQEAGEKGSL